jgi:hypothetical protein
VAVKSSVIRARRSEEVDVLKYAKRRIEIAAKALRHVGDTPANTLEVRSVGDVLVEYTDLSALNGANARDERQ